MTARVLVIAASVFLSSAICVWIAVSGSTTPGTQSSGDPADADYVNVLLVPSLAERLGLDVPLRIRVAKKGARLLYGLRNGSGHDPVMGSANRVNDRVGSARVAKYGRETRALLPAAARSRFETLFSDGKLVRVGYWTEKGRRGAPGGDRFLLTYGWYAEERDRVGQKSLRACEAALERCYEWIVSSDEADLLLDHEDEDVRWAAEKWWDVKDAPPPLSAEERLEKHEANLARNAENSRRLIEESQRKSRAFEERMEARKRERAAEREAFRDKVRAEQEALRARIRAKQSRDR